MQTITPQSNSHMMRVVIAFFFLVVASIKTSVFAQPIAPGKFDTSDIENIERIFSLPEEEIDIGTTALFFSQILHRDLYGQEFDLEKYKALLDQMASELSRRIGHDKSPEETVELINRYLFKEQGFSNSEEKESSGLQNALLNQTLDDRRGECVSLSLLYMALAERIGLPIRGVCLPKHLFVRYENGKTIRNIETTLEGKEASAEYYLSATNGYPPKHPVYMRSLNKKEVLALYLANITGFYSSREMYEKAIALSKIAQTMLPDEAGVHDSLAQIYQKLGDYERAIPEFEKAIALHPNLTPAYINLGVAYEHLGRRDQAIALYKKVISIKLPSPVYKQYIEALAGAHANLGTVYYKDKQLDEAISEFEQAIAIYPDMADAHFNLGTSYVQKEMFDKATPAFQTAVSLNPKHPKAHYNLALMYFAEKNYELAIEHCDKAVELGHPASSWFLEALAPYRRAPKS